MASIERLRTALAMARSDFFQPATLRAYAEEADEFVRLGVEAEAIATEFRERAAAALSGDAEARF